MAAWIEQASHSADQFSQVLDNYDQVWIFESGAMTKRGSSVIERRNINNPEDAIDWQWIELDYREGVMSILDIAIENGIASGLILRRAKQEGWTRAGPSRPARHSQTNADDAEDERETGPDGVAELVVEHLTLDPVDAQRVLIDLDRL